MMERFAFPRRRLRPGFSRHFRQEGMGEKKFVPTSAGEGVTEKIRLVAELDL